MRFVVVDLVEHDCFLQIRFISSSRSVCRFGGFGMV
jgi:hypothetical protein